MEALTSPAETAPIPTAPDSSSPAPTIAPARLASLDAYRGFVMFLMMAEVLKFCKVSAALPASGFWKVLCFHQSHTEWIGCSLHDMIQPSFSFLVGVALPFSIASRTARGQRFPIMLAHAWGRALVLIFLGIFLRSQYGTQTEWGFEDTLSQIGFGYGWLFLLGFRPVRDQWIALGVLLVGYWAAFALYPLPPADFDYAKVSVTADWLQAHGVTGFAAHWQKNSNVAWAFDTWFLNLFRRAQPFLATRGGYATLSFLPTLATICSPAASSAPRARPARSSAGLSLAARSCSRPVGRSGSSEFVPSSSASGRRVGRSTAAAPVSFTSRPSMPPSTSADSSGGPSRSSLSA